MVQQHHTAVQQQKQEVQTPLAWGFSSYLRLHTMLTDVLVLCCRCSDVTDLIKATPEADILRRDISDRPPIL